MVPLPAGALTWAVALASVALFVLTAKAHGRQIRLERELDGYLEVDFRKPQSPFVQTLWRRDRVRYWLIFPALAFLLVGYVVLAWRYALPFPDLATGVRTRYRLALLGGVALLWAASATFATLGAVSARRFLAALREPRGMERRVDAERRGRPAWVARALWGSAAWWGLVVAGAIGTVALLVLW